MTTLMPHDIRQWRMAALFGFFTGPYFALSLIVDTRIGITSSYIQAAYQGQAGPLVELTNGADYVFYSMVILLVWVMRLLLGSLFMLLMRGALLPPTLLNLNYICTLSVIVAVCISLMVGITMHYVLLYADDSNRHTFVSFLKIGNYFYSLAMQAGLLSILWGAYQARRLPPSLCWVGFAFVAVGFVYAQLATNPKLTQFISIMIVFIGALIVAGYMGLVTLRPAPRHPTPATRL